MHMVIDVVVEADDMEVATWAAEEFFERNLDHTNGGPFDYFSLMESGHGVAGSDRWTDYQDTETAFPLSSERGIEEVNEAWENTLAYFEKNIEPAWEAMQNADDMDDFIELLLEDDDLIRHKLNKATGYQSWDYFLYVDGWSSGGIRSYRGWEYLQGMIEKAKESDEDRAWVVPMDVHY